MKVLIIEDDPDVADAIVLALNHVQPDAESIVTESGREGVRWTRYDDLDAVLLDLGLPDVSGFEVLRRIRQFSRIPVIVVSVKSDEADKVKAFELGADDYVVKPFGPHELVARLRLRMSTRPPMGH